MDSITRRSWLLWAVTFAVVLALTATVPLLYLPLVNLATADGDRPDTQGATFTLVGLAGLVLLFCLYTISKQRELNTMRAELARKEHEKETVRARLSELSALFHVSTALNLQLRVDDILEIIVRRVVATLSAQQASVMIVNAADGMLETRASYGLECEFARHARVRLGEGIAGWVAQRGEAVQLDSDSRAELRRHYKTNRQIRSAISLPLRLGERCVGVLNVNRIHHPEIFQPHHREILQIFAEHVGAVIERAEAMEKLDERTRELEADNLKLSEMNRVKEVFLGTASHELKTPLTSVIAYAELLDDNESRLDAGQRREFLGRLRSEASRLLSLIDDILDLSRLESGKLILRRVTLSANDVARAAIDTTRSMAHKKRIEVVESLAADLPDVDVDEVKMRQVLVNLLVNAVKFSPERGRITVRTTNDDGHVRIEIQDEGEGISHEDSAHIFELFGQGEHGRQEGGLGIGLHLVKRITELHGGHVGVNSRRGEGSTFWVRLPFPPAALEPLPLEVAEAA